MTTGRQCSIFGMNILAVQGKAEARVNLSMRSKWFAEDPKFRGRLGRVDLDIRKTHKKGMGEISVSI